MVFIIQNFFFHHWKVQISSVQQSNVRQMPFQVNWSEPMQHENMQIYIMTAKIQMLGKMKLFTFNKYFNNAHNIQPVKYAIKK